MSDTRKAFLLKVLTGAAYSAPVVRSLAAPEGLLGQHSETTGKGGMGMMGATTTNELRTGTFGADSSDISARTAPWEIPPPGGGGSE